MSNFSSRISDSLFDLVIDFFLSLFGWFEPKWKRNARLTIKAAKRYINYNRDIMRPEKKEELESRLNDLKTAFASRDKDATISKTALLEQYAETLSGANRGSLAENVEVFFVIFAIFFGIKAYIAQPFRIPTGSMQPTLNGIRAYDLGEKESPNLAKQGLDMILHGSSYKKAVSNATKTIKDYQDASRFLFTRTNIIFDDNSTVSVPASLGEVQRLILNTKGSYYPTLATGETIFNARFDSGDVVIGDKMTYHFRKPERGEVFIFDTRAIDGVHRRSGDQGAGDFYIKRLVGVPGDRLQIETPTLMVNGKPAVEQGMQRVAKALPPYNPEGYVVASPEGYKTIPLKQYVASPHDVLTLKQSQKQPLLNEYAAFGDNTTNSLDSRYWGPVKQYNLVGPARLALWPFTSHWGIID